MTATDHIIRFNNVLHDVDLLESYERTRAIFEHLLNDVTRDMDEKDQIRFVLRSEQLDTPISVPFLPVERLTTERVFSQIERVIQSNQDFRLNDTVTVDIIHVVAPEGSGKSKLKRTIVNIREYLKKKKSIISINNNDNFCLARALVVAVAKIENDPKYDQIRFLTKKTPITIVIYNSWNNRKRAAITIYCFSILRLHKNTAFTVLICVLFTTKREKWHYFRGRTPLRSFASGYLHLNTRVVLW